MKLDKRFLAVALLLAVACLVATVGAAPSQARTSEGPCRVGSPPTIEDSSILGKPAGPELVVACGHGVTGPFEIASYTDAHGTLCTVYLGEGFGSGQCGEAFHESLLARDGFLTTSTNWAWGGGPGPSYTTIDGWVEPEVARLEVRYHRNGAKPMSKANATIGQVDGDLLSALGETEPFGRFAIVLPGCSVPQGLRILAFNAEGTLIGSEKGGKSSFGGTPCRSAKGGDSGSHDAGGGT
jgi:hypothetical protein